MHNSGVYIIAEIGVNHNGDIQLAKKMIDEASKTGVDAVKFQTFKASNLLVSEKVEKAPYQKREKTENQYTMLKRLELNYDDFQGLKSYCELRGVDFISTPYDGESVDLLSSIGVKTAKIASADLVNKYLIDKILDANLNIILSTGMASFEEIDRTLSYINTRNKDIELIILHTTTSYPTPIEEVNMLVMQEFGKRYPSLKYGYSDHTIGNEAAIMATTMGASIIEKHFTLDRTLDGPDHFASIEPKELLQLVKSIRKVEKALGNNKKNLTQHETENISVMRQSIHANIDMKPGHVITLDDLKICRPYDGVSVWEYTNIIGKVVLNSIKSGTPILEGNIKWT